MKTLNENLIEFKKYLKSEIAKRKELKLIANRSSKDENYNLEETSNAKSKLEETLEDIHAINVAYYIVKHNLNLDEQKKYLVYCNETYKKPYIFSYPQTFTNEYSYRYNRIQQLIKKYKASNYEESKINN